MGLLPESGILMDFSGYARAPHQEYTQIVVKANEVVYRSWKISLRNNAKIFPGETKNSHEDFLDDDRVQGEIHRVFGKHMLEYVIGLASGHIDYLPRLPEPLLLKIIEYLHLEDISQLSQVSKMFRKLCHGDDLWEKIYISHSGMDITPELQSLAEAVTWRKLFFTNKLQLRVQLRRQSHKMHQSSASQNGMDEAEEISSLSIH